jgi:glycosyltransferase involved in cell wall biosynthesis
VSAEVVVLCADLTRNAAGRALVLADLLVASRRVNLMGYASGRVWLPLRTRRDVTFEVIPNRWLPDRRTLDRWRDVTLVAAKPLVRSWGWSLLSRVGTRILDIDDPELALARMDLRTLVRSSLSLESAPFTAALLATRRWATAVTAASGELGRRYGGVVIPHARDEALFAPETVRDRRLNRAALALDGRRPLLVFVGTARPHKGIGTLIRAAAGMPEVDVAIVGTPGGKAAGANVRFVEPLPYLAAMQWIAAADIVVVPQSDGAIGRAQSPAKVVDAMAMGRAIVASRLPPIVELGGDTIQYVPPGDPAALAGGIRRLLADGTERERFERAARSRFLSELSLTAVAPRMAGVVTDAERRSTIHA